MLHNNELFDAVRKFTYTLTKRGLSKSEFDAAVLAKTVEVNQILENKLKSDELEPFARRVGDWTWKKLIEPSYLDPKVVKIEKEERIVMFLRSERIPYSKIAELLDLTPSQVTSRVKRHKKKLMTNQAYAKVDA